MTKDSVPLWQLIGSLKIKLDRIPFSSKPELDYRRLDFVEDLGSSR